MRQQMQHLESVLHAAAGRNPHAQHDLLAIIVHARIEFEIGKRAAAGGWSSR